MVEVILLEKISKYGDLGDVVEVRAGFARNYLLPKGKALRATEENKEVFEKQRKVIEAENKKKLDEAQALADSMKDLVISMERQSDDDGRLYGSVTAKDISAEITQKIDRKIDTGMVRLADKIREIGEHEVEIAVHPDVVFTMKLEISRSH